ncbi:MAG TPA: hypothetical protein VL860_09500, partial [Planctomycetota bacterium]|nr:hypothetical protein [Planctomycetota bacterium]
GAAEAEAPGLPSMLPATLPANTPVFFVSATTGAGCAAFEVWLAGALTAVVSPTQAIGDLIEHLRKAGEAVGRARAAVPQGQELAALAIREALRELEHTLHMRLTPDQRTEAMLDRLFARFCLGK